MPRNGVVLVGGQLRNRDPEDKRLAIQRNREKDIRDGSYALAIGQIYIDGKPRNVARLSGHMFDRIGGCDEAA